MKVKRFSPTAIVALKDALTAIYWYKQDLRSFLSTCIGEPLLVASFDWQNQYKVQVVSDLVDALCRDQERHGGTLLRLCHEVCKLDEFPHLSRLEDGKKKAERAADAVGVLRRMMQARDEIADEEAKIAERQRRAAERLAASQAVRARLAELNDRFCALAVSADAQARGFQLERVMYDLFALFDLDPKASFRNTGEQIDGAFSLDGTDYLFEAKWRQELTGSADLDAFAGKVGRKLDNTLGVFLTMSDFSPDAVSMHSAGRPRILLMSGADLTAVLEGRIDFVSLLQRKKRHAAQTGNIYLRIHEILA